MNVLRNLWPWGHANDVELQNIVVVGEGGEENVIDLADPITRLAYDNALKEVGPLAKEEALSIEMRSLEKGLPLDVRINNAHERMNYKMEGALRNVQSSWFSSCTLARFRAISHVGISLACVVLAVISVSNGAWHAQNDLKEEQGCGDECNFGFEDTAKNIDWFYWTVFGGFTLGALNNLWSAVHLLHIAPQLGAAEIVKQGTYMVDGLSELLDVDSKMLEQRTMIARYQQEEVDKFSLMVKEYLGKLEECHVKDKENLEKIKDLKKEIKLLKGMIEKFRQKIETTATEMLEQVHYSVEKAREYGKGEIEALQDVQLDFGETVEQLSQQSDDFKALRDGLNKAANEATNYLGTMRCYIKQIKELVERADKEGKELHSAGVSLDSYIDELDESIQQYWGPLARDIGSYKKTLDLYLRFIDEIQPFTVTLVEANKVWSEEANGGTEHPEHIQKLRMESGSFMKAIFASVYRPNFFQAARVLFAKWMSRHGKYENWPAEKKELRDALNAFEAAEQQEKFREMPEWERFVQAAQVLVNAFADEYQDSGWEREEEALACHGRAFGVKIPELVVDIL